MTRRELRELIQGMIKEYMGTGSSGGNAGDGNSITSQRSTFDNYEDEMEFYTNQNVYGAEGGHYKREPATHNYNRTKFVKI